MSHYHCEIVMPPTPADKVADAVASILAPFDQNADREERSPHAFWDWYVIGGRWSGAKLQARIPKEKIEAFYAALKARDVTVSGVTCGKQSLSPESQIPDVDALWHEVVPDSGFENCPLFRHAGDSLPMDVCPLRDVPASLSVERVIFAAPSWVLDTDAWTGPLKAEEMLEHELWNGVGWIRSEWDGEFSGAIAWHEKRLEHKGDRFRALAAPASDWTVVTVDYHS